MKNNIILVFIGVFIFQVIFQNILLNSTFMTTDLCEEASDETNHKEDLKQDLKITNFITSRKDKVCFTYHPLSPLHYQTKIITVTYQSVETPPPNVHFIFSRAV